MYLNMGSKYFFLKNNKITKNKSEPVHTKQKSNNKMSLLQKCKKKIPEINLRKHFKCVFQVTFF